MFNAGNVEAIIHKALTEKLKQFKLEPNKMPFHQPILGDERLRPYSLVHSIITSFGQKIFEPVAVYISNLNGWDATPQKSMGPSIAQSAEDRISQIMNELGDVHHSRKPDMAGEVDFIREVATNRRTVSKSLEKADIHLTRGNLVVPIDMKTPKPNASGFKGYKQTLLGWAAAELRNNAEIDVKPLLGIPYNPYDPAPYDRMNVMRYFEVGAGGQILVADQLWSYLANGDEIYGDLIACFERVGRERKREIDEKFEQLENFQRYLPP